MSPLWRDELGIFLAPHKLSLMRLARGVRPKPAGDTGWVNERPGESGWTASLNALDALLAKPEWQGAVARVVVSDQWVRYATVPYASALSGSAERLAHARQILIRIYGEVVGQWKVTLADTAPGATQIACAIPLAFLDELNNLLIRHGTPLKSLQPQLVSAFNHWRPQLPGSGAWFVSIEQGTLSAARFTAKGWDRAHSVRIGGDWTTELRRLQVFGRLVGHSADDGEVYVDAPLALRLAAGNAGTHLHWLDESQPAHGTAGRLEYLRRNLS